MHRSGVLACAGGGARRLLRSFRQASRRWPPMSTGGARDVGPTARANTSRLRLDSLGWTGWSLPELLRQIAPPHRFLKGIVTPVLPSTRSPALRKEHHYSRQGSFTPSSTPWGSTAGFHQTGGSSPRVSFLRRNRARHDHQRPTPDVMVVLFCSAARAAHHRRCARHSRSTADQMRLRHR